MRFSILDFGFAILGVALLAGCESRPACVDAPFFASESEGLTAMLDTQAARGARLDGMLHAPHFEGTRLSGLGRERLEYMLSDGDAAFPLVVYVDLNEKDARTAGRKQAVAAFLDEAGLQAGQYKIEMGANPAYTHPVKGDLAKLAKLDAGDTPAGEQDISPRKHEDANK